MSCKGIFQGADFDCENPLIAGVDEQLTLFNLLDIETITFDIDEPSVITDIILKNGASAFSFNGTRQSLVPEEHFIPGRFSVGYDHQVAFQVFDISQKSKDNLEAMFIRKTVGVVHDKEGSFEVYGIVQGLEGLTKDRLPGDQDTGGSYSIVLKTSDNTAREPKSPQTWLDTDEATTEDLIAALLNQPKVDNISPIIGAAAGGDSFVISGSRFDDAATVDWIDAVGAVVAEPGAVVDSDSQISIAASAALAADTYKIRVTNPNGAVGESALIVVIS